METLFCNEAGEGTPIVFIHGSLSTGMETYAPQMKFFSSSYHCICPDLRCHGKSISRNILWTTIGQSEDIVRTMDSLSIDKAHLVGHSMGGDIMMYVVLNHTDRVLTATSISSAGAVNPSITSYLHRFDPGRPDFASHKEFIERIKKEHGDANYGDWKGFLRQTIWNCDDFPGFTDEELQRMNRPFLVIRGRKDKLVKDREVERLKTFLPDFHLVELDGGHALTTDAQTVHAVNQCLLEFIQSSSDSLIE